MNPARIFVALLALLAFGSFVYLTVPSVRGALIRANKCEVKSEQNPDAQDKCDLTKTQPTSTGQLLLGSLGAALTTIVAGYLGLSGVVWQNAPNTLREAGKKLGGGSEIVGFLTTLMSLLFVASLVYALFGVLAIERHSQVVEYAIVVPNFLIQMATTGIGILVGALALFGNLNSPNG